jgi:AraC-like DNA-binding protein
MKRGRETRDGWRPYGLVRRYDLLDGYEYVNFPSMLARRGLSYPLSLGETKWKPGMQYQHPIGDRCPFHDDRGFLFHYVLGGRLTHRVSGRSFVISRNEAILFDLLRPVHYFNADAKPAHFLWVWFDGIGLSELFKEWIVDPEPVFRGLDRTQTLRLHRLLVSTVKHASPGYELKLSAILAELLAELGRVRPPLSLLTGGTSATALSPAVRSAATTIARKYARLWTIKEIAGAVGLSLSYFCRTFRRETGFTPKEYLNRYRVEQAKVLLLTTKTPVEEIARAVGLPNRNHFGVVFHQVAGVSPREFRAKSSRK